VRDGERSGKDGVGGGGKLNVSETSMEALGGVAGGRVASMTTDVGFMLSEALRAMGIKYAFGIVGGGVAHLVSGLSRAGIELIHVRHEAAAAFMALESYIATGVPGLVFTTTGPGLTNALTGIVASSWEGGNIIVLAGASDSSRDTSPFQQTGSQAISSVRASLAPHALLNATYARGPNCIYAALDRWADATRHTKNHVGLCLVPLSVQRQKCAPYQARSAKAPAAPSLTSSDTQELAAQLQTGQTAIWAGFGARHARSELLSVAEALDANVVLSPRAKGVFPERHPLCRGTTGFAGTPDAHALLRDLDNLLVLGTRLSEFTSFWASEFRPRNPTIHVDRDATAFGHGFLGARVLRVQAEVKSFLTQLQEHLPPPRVRYAPHLPTSSARDGDDDEVHGIHPAVVMATIQAIVVDSERGIVGTEAGNAFAWGTQALRFGVPDYRVSTSFGSMGHFATGLLGAALNTGRLVLSIVGDGAMLMNSELSTAAKYRIPSVWVVLNDAGYGMIRHGFEAVNLPAIDLNIPRVDFVAFARSVGAEGRRANTSRELSDALNDAMETRGPYVIDVRVDPRVAPPFDGRNKNIRASTEEQKWRG
jgi:acetolactate synthase-1/2/3 large subunit